MTERYDNNNNPKTMPKQNDQAAGVTGGGEDLAAPVEPVESEQRERGEVERLAVVRQERNRVKGHLATEERPPMRLARNK